MYCSDVKRGETLELRYGKAEHLFYICYGGTPVQRITYATKDEDGWLHWHDHGKCIASVYVDSQTDSKTSVRVYASDEVQIKKGKA